MAVVSCTEAQAAATLTAKLKGVREWTCPYNVEVESATDDAWMIVDYFSSIGRGLSASLKYGATRDDSVRCKQITPVRKANSTTQWSVTLVYTPPQYPENEGFDVHGNPTDDPTEWKMEIDCGTQYYQVPVWKAWNIDQMPLNGVAPGYSRAVNSLGPVHNSAGIVYDPPLMRELPETVLRVTGNAYQYYQPYFSRVVGRVNRTNLFWAPEMAAYDFGHHGPMEPHCVLCNSGTASYRYIEGAGGGFWRYTYEFRIRERTDTTDTGEIGINPQDGFLESILDRGITRIANAGAPDGVGGTISLTDIEVGMAEAAAIRDFQGERVPEMVLLDGHGRPLQGSNTNQAPPVYFRWRIHPYGNFPWPDIPLRIFRY